MDIIFNTCHYHRCFIHGIVLHSNESHPPWKKLHIQRVLAELQLKQSTAVWLIYLLLMAVLLIDIRVMGGFGTAPAQTLQFIFLAGICMVSGVMVYALAYTARFAQDTKHILTNSLLMAIRHLPKTLLLIIILAAAVLGCYLFGLAVVLVPAVAALLDSLILESIFVQYMSKEDLEKEELRNHPEQYEYVNRRE